jgi:hypothetical protein
MCRSVADNTMQWLGDQTITRHALGLTWVGKSRLMTTNGKEMGIATYVTRSYLGIPPYHSGWLITV